MFSKTPVIFGRMNPPANNRDHNKASTKKYIFKKLIGIANNNAQNETARVT